MKFRSLSKGLKSAGVSLALLTSISFSGCLSEENNSKVDIVPTKSSISYNVVDPLSLKVGDFNVLRQMYGRDLSWQFFDFYEPEKRADNLAVFDFSPGAWRAHRPDNYVTYGGAEYFSSTGVPVFAVNRRRMDRDSSGTKGIEEQILDGFNGIKFALGESERYSVDPSRVVIRGGSAGGHIAWEILFHNLSLPENERIPLSGIFTSSAIYNLGPFDLTNSGVSRDGEIDRFLQNAYSGDLQDLSRLSPINKLEMLADSESIPQIAISSYVEDPVIPVSQSDRFYGRAKELGIPITYFKFHGIEGHVISFPENKVLTDPYLEILAFDGKEESVVSITPPQGLSDEEIKHFFNNALLKNQNDFFYRSTHF